MTNKLVNTILGIAVAGAVCVAGVVTPLVVAGYLANKSIKEPPENGTMYALADRLKYSNGENAQETIEKAEKEMDILEGDPAFFKEIQGLKKYFNGIPLEYKLREDRDAYNSTMRGGLEIVEGIKENHYSQKHEYAVAAGVAGAMGLTSGGYAIYKLLKNRKKANSFGNKKSSLIGNIFY